MTAREDVSFLVGSECRVETLVALRETPQGPSAVARRASCARETAQRNLAEFVDRNWVTKEDRTYRLTVTGELVLDAYQALESTVDSATRLTTFLSHLDESQEDVPATLLSDQQVTTATGENPHAPINRWLDMIGDERIEEYYGFTGIVSRMFNDAAERVIDGETVVELVIDESVLRTSSEEYPDALQLAYELDGFTLYVSPRSLDFGLAICDGHAWVGVYDDFGNVVASVDGDDPAFIEWATDVYERHRAAATVSSGEPEQTPSQP